MIFVGFMEGSKTVRYWDKDGRAIKVSRNFTFNENEELKELQVVELPSLEAEGENLQGTASQTVLRTPKVLHFFSCLLLTTDLLQRGLLSVAYLNKGIRIEGTFLNFLIWGVLIIPGTCDLFQMRCNFLYM